MEGIKLFLNGREFIARPVTLAFIRANADFFEGTKSPTVGLMADTVYASLVRNHPDLSKDDLEENFLDVMNLKDAFAAVMGTSGVNEKK